MTNTEKTNHAEAKNAISAAKRTPKILTVRHVKTYSFYRASRCPSIFRPRPKELPQIRLSGNWLQNAGFTIDRNLTITVMKNMLIIRPAKEIEN
ncbi:SymE family type I addiction module toxin [Flavobacterium tructae]|uniref:SymE family type I addiction module toxin n=1 Tax=Flavobacterium tructae TaxID=1114873 RepID=UPI0035A9A290